MIIKRSDGYIGVMIDDLTMKGAEEPCQSSFPSSRPHGPL